MSIHRFAARSDSNRKAIVDALRAVGAVVYDSRRPVDLLVGFRRTWHLLEIKMPPGPRGGTSGRDHTPAQKKFIAEALANECPVHTVSTPEEALRAIGA